MLKNKAVVLAKIETTYGVDPTPTGGANAILCGDVEYDVIDSKVERNNIKPIFGAKRFVAIGEGQKLSFTTEIKASGSLGVAPEIGPLFRACGFTQTVLADTHVYYTPNSSTSGESVTLYYYVDGLLHEINGCRGSFSVPDAKVNQYGTIKWEFTGIYGGPVAATLATPTFNATIPPVFRGANFSLDGYSAVIDGISLDVKNDIAKRVDVNSTNGVLEWFIKERAITAKIAPEMVLPASKDFWGMWSDGDTCAMAVTFGQTAGNKCVIAAQYVQVDKPKYGDRENILTAELPLVITPGNSGDDDISFYFQ